MADRNHHRQGVSARIGVGEGKLHRARMAPLPRLPGAGYRPGYCRSNLAARVWRLTIDGYAGELGRTAKALGLCRAALLRAANPLSSVWQKSALASGPQCERIHGSGACDFRPCGPPLGSAPVYAIPHDGAESNRSPRLSEPVSVSPHATFRRKGFLPGGDPRPPEPYEQIRCLVVNWHAKGTPYRRPKGTPFVAHWE